MRMRPAPLLLAVLTAALLLAGGCTDGGDTSGGDTASELDGLEVGTTAPEFRLKNQDQTTVALSDYIGTKNVILVFYPADFTPV
jgi:cytochrome oxidase Cu insertion factor (SCO1/SenC/PrrC family)